MNNLNIWRLHPKSCKIIKAEKTLVGTANPGGVKWCSAYSKANSFGYWLFSPIDIDVCWRGGKDFEYNFLENWSDADHYLVKSLLKENIDINKFCPESTGRTKTTFAAVENAVMQFWTGIIFETSPGWILEIRSPINFPSVGYKIMEGIIESDWMQYDIWMNIIFEKKDEWIKFRKDSSIPIAQLIPIRRESIDGDWSLTDNMVNRDTKEANRVFEYWLQYNDKKFGHGGNNPLSSTDPTLTKDSTTFWKERMRLLGKDNMEPVLDEAKELSCPYKHIKPIFVRKNEEK